MVTAGLGKRGQDAADPFHNRGKRPARKADFPKGRRELSSLQLLTSKAAFAAKAGPASFRGEAAEALRWRKKLFRAPAGFLEAKAPPSPQSLLKETCATPPHHPNN